MNRLVLCVEGQGDVDATPVLVSRLLRNLPEEHQGAIFLDSRPLEVGAVRQLMGKEKGEWQRYLEIIKKTRSKLGAVLLLLDGDEKKKVEDQLFCPVQVARTLAERARSTGAGRLFSVSVVFVRQEFESLLIAGYSSLPGCRPNVALPPYPEEAPRGAKEWLADNLDGGYKETQHQVMLTRAVDLDLIRTGKFRSFQRLEHAVQELAAAVQTGQHISTPASSLPES